MPNFAPIDKQYIKSQKKMTSNSQILKYLNEKGLKYKTYSILLVLVLFGGFSLGSLYGQNLEKTKNADFSKKINSMLNFSIPIITVQELNQQKNITILDARESKEFLVSHIPKALNIGYKHMDKAIVEGLDKNKTVVLYCSIGYRSEKMGEKLKKLGFTKIYNLYGSIFEWVNQGYALEDAKGLPTNKVHAYNKSWSKWVENNKYEKVY